MGYRSRVYRTSRLGRGIRIIDSIETSTWIIWNIIKFIFKLIFFWIYIPIKLLKK